MNRKTAAARTIDGRIVVILMLAAGLRLAWIATLSGDEASLDRLPDQREYLELGRNLLDHHELKFLDTRFDDVVHTYRTPGYPLMVAMCDGDLQLVRVAQALLDTSSVVGVYLLSLALSRKRQEVALFAAVIVAVNPFLIYFCGLVLSETLFTAMLVWGMFLLVVPRRAIAWWAGVILLALAVLVRPSAIGLPVILGVISIFVNRERGRPYDWRWASIGAVAVTILVLLPWAWRNDRLLGRWIWTTTNKGITQYDGFNPDATGASDQRFIATMPQLKAMNEVDRSQYLAKLSRQFIGEHPLRAIELGAIKIARTWSPVPLSREYEQPKFVLIALVYMIPLYVLVVRGLWRGQTSLWVKLYLMAPALYFTMVHAISIGSLRYRVPADLPMAIVAAFAVATASSGAVKS